MYSELVLLHETGSCGREMLWSEDFWVLTNFCRSTFLYPCINVDVCVVVRSLSPLLLFVCKEHHCLPRKDLMPCWHLDKNTSSVFWKSSEWSSQRADRVRYDCSCCCRGPNRTKHNTNSICHIIRCHFIKTTSHTAMQAQFLALLNKQGLISSRTVNKRNDSFCVCLTSFY